MRKIDKKTLHEEIANQLRDMIMTGELREGEKVNENALCQSMGVSKTPLREALRVLSAEGLIRLVPNRGAFVSRPTLEEIREMFDVMTVLEGMCAGAAAGKMTSEELARLEELHQRLEENYGRRDQAGYIRENNLYHAYVQEVAGNRTLNWIVEGLRKRILLYRFQSLNLAGRFERSIQEHRELLEAFRKRDAARAEALMKRHLMAQYEALETMSREESSGREGEGMPEATEKGGDQA